MLQTLYENYLTIRQILPHPRWFSTLTGINERVADNVLAGTRKISVRHIVAIARAFGLSDASLQFPIRGALDPFAPDNLRRQEWLRACIATHGTPRRACLRYPGLGAKTLPRMVRQGTYLSPIMCELIARHTGWDCPDLPAHLAGAPGVIGLDIDELVGAVRLARLCEVNESDLPLRTQPTQIAVTPALRYQEHTLETLMQVLQSADLDVMISLHVSWFFAEVSKAIHAQRITAAQARMLRRELKQRRETRRKQLTSLAQMRLRLVA